MCCSDGLNSVMKVRSSKRTATCGVTEQRPILRATSAWRRQVGIDADALGLHGVPTHQRKVPMDITVYYATNRAHEGAERFMPERYG